MNVIPRIVCNFSCGAASAIAAKLVVAQLGAAFDVAIVNSYLKEEHPDNRRFLKDCEAWFGREIIQLADTKYGASATEVFRRKRFLKSRIGAPCSRELKRRVLDDFSRPDDIHVLGYTIEEEDRFEDFKTFFPTVYAHAPLIEAKLTKADCLAMLENAGIEMPAMYRLGYNNANCIGCVKGGQGYWNKVRRDFPERFTEMALLELSLGPGAYLFRNRTTGVRYPLFALDPASGRHDEVLPSCSAFCETAEAEFEHRTFDRIEGAVVRNIAESGIRGDAEADFALERIAAHAIFWTPESENDDAAPAGAA